MSRVTRDQVFKLVGKHIYALRKDGTTVSGKLVKISGSRLILERPNGKKVSTKAILPLALFDLLAIGTAPFAFGPWGGGFGGFGGFGGVGGFGPWGGWW
jgi:hypothetical protein